MPYVEARNVADTAKLATSLGAKIMHGPQEIPNIGHIAIIQDPQGAVFGLYTSTSGGNSWEGTPVVGQFSWNELMTADHARAFDFYRRLFGWDKVDEMDMGDGLMYRTFGKGETMYGGMYTTPKEMAGMHPFWLCYIHVRDVPKALATATKAGASVHRPPMDIPGGVIAILGDPQGAGFALHHLSVAAPASAAPKTTARAKSGSRKKSKPAARGAKKKKVAPRSAARKSRTRATKSAAKKRGRAAARKVTGKAAKKK
jgi:hypothetical protein